MAHNKSHLSEQQNWNEVSTNIQVTMLPQTVSKEN